MASEEKEEGSEQEGGKKKGNMMLFVIIGAVVLLLIVILLVVVMMMGGEEAPPADPNAPNQAAAPAAQAADAGKPKQQPAKIKTDLLTVGPMYELPQVIVNLLSQSGRRYLKTKISLELSGEELLIELDTKKAVVSDTVIGVLSSKTIEEISTIKGKEKLKEELVSRINEFLKDGTINNIFFTDFVIQ